MSDCDCHKNIKKLIGEVLTVAATVAKKPNGDGLLITTVDTTTTAIFFGLRAVGVGQQGALLISMSLVYLMSLPVWKR